MRLLAVCLCAFFATTLSAKDTPTYPSSEAKAHVGEYATVVGRVSGVHETSKGDILVNLGPKYPDNDFTIVVFADDVEKFSDLDALEGSAVSITGKIKDYHGKPEIVASAPEQLRKLKSH